MLDLTGDVESRGHAFRRRPADAADTDADVEPLTVTTTGTFEGTYGRLVLAADGSYTYTLYTLAEKPAAYAALLAGLAHLGAKTGPELVR